MRRACGLRLPVPIPGWLMQQQARALTVHLSLFCCQRAQSHESPSHRNIHKLPEGDLKSHPCPIHRLLSTHLFNALNLLIFKQFYFLNTKKKITFKSFPGHWISHSAFGVDIRVVTRSKQKRGERNDFKDNILPTAHGP